MENDQLRRSLQARQVYYSQVFAQMFPERVIQQQKQESLHNLYSQISQLEHLLAGIEAEFGHKYDPNQPRVPAGHPDGGQWTR